MSTNRSSKIQSHHSRIGHCGFALVALMVALPLAMTCLACLAAMALIVKQDTRGRSLCEKHALLTQKDIAHHLQELMRLNPEARSLRLNLETLRAEYAAAMAAEQVEALPELQAEIDEVQSAQKALDATQKGIIALANYTILQDEYQWHVALSKHMSSILFPQRLRITATPR